MKLKLKLSAYLLCEVFEGYEHEIVQASPNIRQTPKWRSTTYYLGEDEKVKGKVRGILGREEKRKVKTRDGVVEVEDMSRRELTTMRQ